MFTGLVETMGTIEAVRDEPPGKRLVVRASSVAADAKLGDSVCVSGCCLTIVEIVADALAFEAGPETLSRTKLGRLQQGDRVNLEQSLRVGDLLGGHFVTGHVDGLGTLAERRDEASWSTLWFDCPAELAMQMAAKGSIAVDGVSLTLVDVERRDAQAARFSVALIPHTLAITTLGQLKPGDRVNLETDLLAKYVGRTVASSR